MNSKLSGNHCMHFSDKKTAGKFLFILFLFLSSQSFGQSYFYMENKFASLPGDSITYFTFLTINADGSSTARVRYIEPTTKDDRLFELKLVDSLLPGQKITLDNNNKYLMCAEQPYLVNNANDDSGFLVPRFIFKKQFDGRDSFYLPFAVECKGSGDKWMAATMNSFREITYDELAKQESFVQRFFSETSEFYNYIFHPQLVSRDPNSPKRKEKLFLIAVANTNDSSIGVSSQKDLDNITSTFTTLTNNLGMPLVLTRVAGNGFRKGAVDTAIIKLNPQSIDIVVFYFSGHGFRYADDTSKYPRMSLRANWKLDRGKNNMGVEEVYKKIIKKGAKVNIILADCCNENIEVNAPAGRDLLRTKGWGVGSAQQQLNMENCIALFFPPKPISILTSSTDVNQLAIGNPRLGGFFTCFFKTELDKSLYSYESSKSWLRLLLNAKEKARYQSLSALCGTSRCVQTATFRVESSR